MDLHGFFKFSLTVQRENPRKQCFRCLESFIYYHSVLRNDMAAQVDLCQYAGGLRIRAVSGFVTTKSSKKETQKRDALKQEEPNKGEAKDPAGTHSHPWLLVGI